MKVLPSGEATLNMVKKMVDIHLFKTGSEINSYVRKNPRFYPPGNGKKKKHATIRGDLLGEVIEQLWVSAGHV